MASSLKHLQINTTNYVELSFDWTTTKHLHPP
jgi:hypothetical protein